MWEAKKRSFAYFDGLAAEGGHCDLIARDGVKIVLYEVSSIQLGFRLL